MRQMVRLRNGMPQKDNQSCLSMIMLVSVEMDFQTCLILGPSFTQHKMACLLWERRAVKVRYFGKNRRYGLGTPKFWNKR